MVLVRLLGPVDVVDGSGTVHSPDSALRRTLLALLAIHAGEVLTADWLMEHTWNGQPPESGLRALRFHISRLRKEIGHGDLIETCPGGYRLTVSVDQVDARAVEAKTQAAGLERDRGVAAGMYAEILAVWRGVPFVDAAPCSDLDDEAIRLAEAQLSITEAQFQARLDSGAGSEIVADLTRATTQHPLRELLWRMLMTAQYRAGLQADALRSYEQLRVLLAESLGLEPSLDLQDLQRRILQHDSSLARGVEDAIARHNLPIPATTRIDTDDQLSFVSRQLRDHRLLTLTGTGGLGKTRLAVDLGWSCLDRFAAGVWLVELAPVQDPDAVVAAVAATLSVPPQPGLTPVESLIDWLHGRELLLIVDNCEHVLGAAARLLAIVLARCPTVKVVATSREPLGLGGERVHLVSLMNPDSEGVALFVDRATAADSSFELTDVEHAAVTDICRRLDGLPLAIELAAARVRSIAPVDLLARLDDRFKLLRAGRSALDRHEELEATVDWSYRLLSESERGIFDRLSVFAGSFDLAAVEAICSLHTISASDVVNVLLNLVDKSMVVADRTSTGTRYRLLETLRQFGRRQLDSAGLTSEIRERHLRHFVGVAEEADTVFRSSRQVAGATIFDQDWDNLRTAHDWAVANANLAMAERLLASTRMYAYRRMRFEHGDWAEATIALATAERRPSPDAFAQAAYWAYRNEDMERAFQLLDRGLDVAASLEEPSAAQCLSSAREYNHPRISDQMAQFEAATSTMDFDKDWWVLIELVDIAHEANASSLPAHLDRLMEAAERVRSPTLMVAAAIQRGHACIDRRPSDFAAALEFYLPALETARLSGSSVSEGDCLRTVAMCNVGLQSDASAAACRDALVRLYEIRYWFRIWQLMESCAVSLALSGHVEAASILVGHLEEHHPPYGLEHDLGFRSRTLQIVGSESRVEEWMARGAALDRHQIVQFALAALQ